MQRATLLKIGKRVIQIGLPIVVVALFLRYITGVWHDLTAHTFHWDFWLLALAFFGFVLQELSYGLIWRAVLIRLGHRLKLRVTLRIYLASEFVRYSHILLVTLAWCGSWFIAGCAFFVLLLGIWPSAPLAALPVCIGIYAIAWDIGFLAFITPSGLVFREGAIVALFALAFPLPAGLSAIIAILSRFVSTLAELLCVSVAYLSGDGSKQVRALQEAEQAGQEKTQEAEDVVPADASVTDKAGAMEDAAVSISGEGGQ